MCLNIGTRVYIDLNRFAMGVKDMNAEGQKRTAAVFQNIKETERLAVLKEVCTIILAS